MFASSGEMTPPCGLPLGARELALRHDARLQPLANQTEQHSVAYPLAKDLSQMTVIQGVEELSYIGLQDPPAMHRH